MSKFPISLSNPKIDKLKEDLENLFPGQWISSKQKTKTLSTGLTFIDQSISRGLARQKISAWVGPSSSGKTSLLRSIIGQWLNCGLTVAYIDTQNKLLASNWTCFENTNNESSNKFWVIRNLSDKDYFWASETLISSHIFDVIILDIDLDKNNKFNTQFNWQSTKIYSRLQNALSKSKTALILTTNDIHLLKGWHFCARLDFQWSENIQYTESLNGKTMILPAINCSITKAGLSHHTEIPITAHITNHLFTHAPISDRRSTKV